MIVYLHLEGLLNISSIQREGQGGGGGIGIIMTRMLGPIHVQGFRRELILFEIPHKIVSVCPQTPNTFYRKI